MEGFGPSWMCHRNGVVEMVSSEGTRMKLDVSARDLTMALRHLKPAARRGGAVRLTAAGERLTLVTDDGALRLEVGLGATVAESGTVAVPLSGLAAQAKGREPLTLIFEDDHLIVGAVGLAVIGTEDQLCVPDPVGDDETALFEDELGEDELVAVRDRVAVMASDDDARPTLTNVQLSAQSPKRRCWVATDSYRLATLRRSGVTPTRSGRGAKGDKPGVLLPARVFTTMTSWWEALKVPFSGASLLVGQAAARLEVSAGTWTFCSTARRYDADYPNWRELKGGGPHQVTVSRSVMAEQLRVARKIGETSSPVRMHIDKTSVELAITSDRGGWNGSVPVQDTNVGGGAHDLCFGLAYLDSVVVAGMGDQLSWEWAGATTAVRFTSDNAQDWYALLMPVRPS